MQVSLACKKEGQGKFVSTRSEASHEQECSELVTLGLVTGMQYTDED